MKSRKPLPRSVTIPVWLAALAVINLVLLNLIALRGMLSSGRLVLGESTTNSCPTACITKMNQLLGKSTTTVKEYYVPLGSGTNATDEWTDVAGASAYVDAASYGKIKKVTFEANLSQPKSSQRIWVRLVNATEGRVIAGSEMTTEAAGPVTLTSPALTLDAGNKLYQVQIKTQLKGLTYLNQSRLRITTY